jgi:hypothetical protein
LRIDYGIEPLSADALQLVKASVFEGVLSTQHQIPYRLGDKDLVSASDSFDAGSECHSDTVDVFPRLHVSDFTSVQPDANSQVVQTLRLDDRLGAVYCG